MNPGVRALSAKAEGENFLTLAISNDRSAFPFLPVRHSAFSNQHS